MTTRVSPHSRLGRRERRTAGLGCLAGGLMLALSGLHGVIPVAAQTVTVPIPYLEDRPAGTDDVLQQTHGLGIDDSALVDLPLGIDVPQEDRQADRQMEVGDDRLTVIQPEQQIEAGDVRQEDRGQAPDDSRRSSSGPDDSAKPYYGSSSSTVSSSRGNDRSATSSSTTAPVRSGGNSSGGSGHGGGHDDGGGHH